VLGDGKAGKKMPARAAARDGDVGFAGLVVHGKSAGWKKFSSSLMA
jgi:hypothetical protein